MKYNFQRNLIIAVLYTCVVWSDCIAQYDTVHYLPPFYARSADPQDLGRNYLFLATNETTPFDVVVTEADGTVLATATIAQNAPFDLHLGYQYNCVGIIDPSQLNSPLQKEGIIVRGSKPFSANIRHKSGSQGMSLTAKGTAALGTTFRSGHLYTRESSDSDAGYKAHMISVMATEDNTVVTFSEVKSGVVFHNATGFVNGQMTVTLNKYESYVIATHLDEQTATANDIGINGTKVTATAPIVVNTGSWCGGSNVTNAAVSRDIGMDQIVPVQALGNEHIITKRHSYLENECEKVIVVSNYDNTKLFLNGDQQVYTTLDAGEFAIIPASEYDVNDIMYVRSSAGVYVYQSTNASDLASHNQGMNFIPPILCTGMNEVTIPNTDSFDGSPASIDIISRVGSAVFVDNTLLTQVPYAVPGNPNWQVYKLSGVTGTVHIESENIINVTMLNASATRGAATYFSGFSQRVGPPSMQMFSNNGGSVLGEGCLSGKMIVSKPQELLDADVIYQVTYSGSAQNGVDYLVLPDTVYIPAGTLLQSYDVIALEDFVNEGTESFQASIIDPWSCNMHAVTASLTIERDRTISFEVLPEMRCAPHSATFVNTTDMGTNDDFLWEFGDGSVSSDISPKHIYEQDGIFDVTLYLYTGGVCQDTLALTKSDLVLIHPSPTADFSLSTHETTICDSRVEFYDASMDAVSVSYFFDDTYHTSMEANTEHVYQTDGMHRPYQVAENIYGCTDTAYQELYVEPFNVFVPNTFTPNGDQFNNTFNAVVDLTVAEWELSIYNQWGELVFVSQNIDEGWTGLNMQGLMSPDGTYIWKAKYKSCEPVNPPHVLTGHVNLIR